eukprot:330451-Chlamydomonas_euryale.AAC.1
MGKWGSLEEGFRIGRGNGAGDATSWPALPGGYPRRRVLVKQSTNHRVTRALVTHALVAGHTCAGHTCAGHACAGHTYAGHTGTATLALSRVHCRACGATLLLTWCHTFAHVCADAVHQGPAGSMHQLQGCTQHPCRGKPKHMPRAHGRQCLAGCTRPGTGAAHACMECAPTCGATAVPQQPYHPYLEYTPTHCPTKKSTTPRLASRAQTRQIALPPHTQPNKLTRPRLACRVQPETQGLAPARPSFHSAGTLRQTGRWAAPPKRLGRLLHHPQPRLPLADRVAVRLRRPDCRV